MKNHHSDIEYVIPGWNDPQKQRVLLQHMMQYALEMGFKPEEVQNMRDRRLLLLTYKAMTLDHQVHKHAKGN